jgi:hypothetical protein
MFSRYDPAKFQHGYNTVDDEKMFFIANPGLGLWVPIEADSESRECDQRWS